MGEEALGPKGKPVLLFDLDGICANLAAKWLDAYNREWDDDLTLDEIVEWEWHRFVRPECGKRIYQYLNRPGFFADLEPIPGALPALERLKDRAELVVLTASPRGAMADKVNWVRRHLPFIPKENVIITHRKDLVAGDVLFDDAPRNLRHFRGVRVLMDYPYNRNFHDAYRVRDWAAFEALMERVLADLQAGRPVPPYPGARAPARREGAVPGPVPQPGEGAVSEGASSSGGAGPAPAR